MKIIFLLMTLFSMSTFANNQIGFILGSPTGLSYKRDLGNNKSIDAALAYSLRDQESLVVHSTYLFEKEYQFDIEKVATLFAYFGVGLRLAIIDEGKHNDDISMGFRFPLGLTYDLNSPNIQIFSELSAVTNFIPDTDIDFDLGIGARFKF